MGLGLFLESEEVVTNSAGRKSRNVESCLQGAGFLGGGIEDESSRAQWVRH